MHPFHLQRVWLFQVDDYPNHVEFRQWFLQKTSIDPNFPTHVLFTDETSSTREGVFNSHNFHLWDFDNMQGTRGKTAQHRFAVSMGTGIIGDSFLGPYLL